MDARKGSAKINQSVRDDIENSVLCWLATVDAEGDPNVTPKEMFSSYGDDHIVIADIASSNTVQNIRHRPAVCVSFIDVFRQRGFKIAGAAEIIDKEDLRFPFFGSEIIAMAGDDFPVRNLISVRIKKIYRIWAPSYRIFPNQNEADRMQAAYNAYGVLPAK